MQAISNSSKWLIKHLPFLIVFSFVAYFYLSLTNNIWLISPDSTDYVEGAKSIAQFRGYVDTNGRALTFFPPGASIIYSVAAFFSKDGYLLFNLLTKILVLGFIFFSYLLIKRIHGNIIALFSILILSFSQIIIYESFRLLSDIPFAFLFVFTIYFFNPEKLSNFSFKKTALLGALLAFNFLIRTPAVFIFFGYFFYWFLWEKRKKQHLPTLAAFFILTTLPWWLYTAKVKGDYSYFSLFFLKQSWILDAGAMSLTDWLDRISKNFNDLILLTNQMLLGHMPKGVWSLVLAILIVLGLVGSRKNNIIKYYFILLFVYFLELVTCEGGVEGRYLIPIAPIILILALDPIKKIFERINIKYAYSLLPSLILLLLLATNYFGGGIARAQRINKQMGLTSGVVDHFNHEGFQKLILANNSSLKPGDVICVLHPNIVKYFVPKNVTLKHYLLTSDVDRLYEHIVKSKATYIYLEKGKYRAREYLFPLLEKYQKHFTVIAENQDAVIYRFVGSYE